MVKGGKGLTNANGINVPLIAHWPGRIPGGVVIPDLVDSTDFLPTIAELAGVALPGSWGADGVSFAPRLLGQPGKPREWSFFWHDPRPGWDKENRTRQIFALDHHFKLYRDGRFSMWRRTPRRQPRCRGKPFLPRSAPAAPESSR